MLDSATMEDTAAYFFDKIKENGFKFDKNFFVSHVAERTEPLTGEKKEVSLGDFFAGKPNVTMRERTEEEKRHIKNVKKAYEKEYRAITSPTDVLCGILRPFSHMRSYLYDKKDY